MRTLCLAEYAKLSRNFWIACTWRRSWSCSLLCNRDNYGWETIKQLAGTHFYFKTPEHPPEITYTAYILLWMLSFSICTKANYRKLLHLFTLENLKGKQSRPPSKSMSFQRGGHFFPKTCSFSVLHLSLLKIRQSLGFVRNRFGAQVQMVFNISPLTYL